MKLFFKENWFKIIVAMCAVVITYIYATKAPSNEMTVTLDNDRNVLGGDDTFQVELVK